MVSVDCDVYAKMLVAREWEGVSQHLLKGIDRLVLAGCNMICIASNTGHIVYPAITSKYPDVSVLHIADATAAAIKVSTEQLVGREVDGALLFSRAGSLAAIINADVNQTC